jgi:hypothetical protein
VPGAQDRKKKVESRRAELAAKELEHVRDRPSILSRSAVERGGDAPHERLYQHAQVRLATRRSPGRTSRSHNLGDGCTVAQVQAFKRAERLKDEHDRRAHLAAGALWRSPTQDPEKKTATRQARLAERLASPPRYVRSIMMYYRVLGWYSVATLGPSPTTGIQFIDCLCPTSTMWRLQVARRARGHASERQGAAVVAAVHLSCALACTGVFCTRAHNQC